MHPLLRDILLLQRTRQPFCPPLRRLHHPFPELSILSLRPILQIISTTHLNDPHFVVSLATRAPRPCTGNARPYASPPRLLALDIVSHAGRIYGIEILPDFDRDVHKRAICVAWRKQVRSAHAVTEAAVGHHVGVVVMLVFDWSPGEGCANLWPRRAIWHKCRCRGHGIARDTCDGHLFWW